METHNENESEMRKRVEEIVDKEGDSGQDVAGYCKQSSTRNCSQKRKLSAHTHALSKATKTSLYSEGPEKVEELWWIWAWEMTKFRKLIVGSTG